MHFFKKITLNLSKISLALIIVGLFLFAACRPKVEVVNSELVQMKISTEVQSLADLIAKDNYIGTEYIARKPQTDPAYTRRMELMTMATDNELLALTGNPNAIVSLVAFEGLYNRGNSTVPSVLNGLKSRSEKINYLQGDLMREMPMLEYAFVHVMRYTMPDEQAPYDEIVEPKFSISPSEQKNIIEKIDAFRAKEE